MSIPITDGRNFTDADHANAQPVAIVSESFAHKCWPGEDAVGKYLSILRDTPVPRRVVGIVGDVKATIEDEPAPTMYVSYKQLSFPSMQIVLLSRDEWVLQWLRFDRRCTASTRISRFWTSTPWSQWFMARSIPGDSLFPFWADLPVWR
jgi:MacB-like periplasmic core domain